MNINAKGDAQKSVRRPSGTHPQVQSTGPRDNIEQQLQAVGQLLLTRRQIIKALAAISLHPVRAAFGSNKKIWVNDVHSQLNETAVSEIDQLDSFQQASDLVKKSIANRQAFSICGARHAGGGQQFLTNAPLVDTTSLNQVLAFDSERGLLEVQPGIRWPALLSWLEAHQKNDATPWGVRQKQTGNDDLTIGGAISCNAHGQGLKFKPFVSDIEELKLITAADELVNCSRSENAELFKLVIGGYGNFGLITSATIRLVPRTKVSRKADWALVKNIPALYAACLEKGCTYGDFQCSIDERSDDFLRKGIFSCYHPVEAMTPLSELTSTSGKDWLDLACLAHKDKEQAFKRLADRYLKSSGQVNWPDVWQSSPYVADYHRTIDTRMHAQDHATEVLTELYVPLADLPSFMEDVRSDFLSNQVNLIYSTVRFIDTDDETFLPWARERSACIIFNLHATHTPAGIEHVKASCQRLIDHAIKYSGRYYLTYHRFARKEQVLACYPEFPQFIKLKHQYDPKGIFRSDWYDHYNRMFG